MPCPAARRQISLDRPAFSITRRPGSKRRGPRRDRAKTAPRRNGERARSTVSDRGEPSSAALLLCTAIFRDPRRRALRASPLHRLYPAEWVSRSCLVVCVYVCVCARAQRQRETRKKKVGDASKRVREGEKTKEARRGYGAREDAGDDKKE